MCCDGALWGELVVQQHFSGILRLSFPPCNSSAHNMDGHEAGKVCNKSPRVIIMFKHAAARAWQQTGACSAQVGVAA